MFILEDILPGVHWGNFSNPVRSDGFTFSALGSSCYSLYHVYTIQLWVAVGKECAFKQITFWVWWRSSVRGNYKNLPVSDTQMCIIYLGQTEGKAWAKFLCLKPFNCVVYSRFCSLKWTFVDVVFLIIWPPAGDYHKANIKITWCFLDRRRVLKYSFKKN